MEEARRCASADAPSCTNPARLRNAITPRCCPSTPEVEEARNDQRVREVNEKRTDQWRDQERALHKLNQLESRLYDLEEKTLYPEQQSNPQSSKKN